MLHNAMSHLSAHERATRWRVNGTGGPHEEAASREITDAAQVLEDRGVAVAGTGGPRILGRAEIGNDLFVSHVMFRDHEWLVAHPADCPPELVTSATIQGPSRLPVVLLDARRDPRGRPRFELAYDVRATSRPCQRIIHVRELRIDTDAQRVTVRDQEVVLTRLQFGLLVILAERRDRVQSRTVLLRDVWALRSAKYTGDHDLHGHTRAVDIQVNRLRDRLGTAARFVQSVRGEGYRFSENT